MYENEKIPGNWCVKHLKEVKKRVKKKNSHSYAIKELHYAFVVAVVNIKIYADAIAEEEVIVFWCENRK